jgi:nitrogen fixation protein FixH
MWVPVGLLAATLAGLGTMASIAARDPGFALETNYYDRAVHWDREQAQWAENARLGFHVEAGFERAPHGNEVVARVTDRSGAPLRGAAVRAEAFANARAGERRSLELREQPDGSYRAPLGKARPGLWELRLSVERTGARFTHTARADLPAEPRP